GMPLGGEAVLSQRVVLGPQLGELGLVRGEAQASGALERIACEQRDPAERSFAQLPEQASPLVPELAARGIIGRRGAAQSEASVAAARTLGHTARVVHANARPGA